MRPTALITGASVGIGYELAKQFAAGGHDLVLVARNREKLETVAAELKSAHNVAADVLVADLAQREAPQQIFDALTGRPIDVLVNNAGFGAIGKFHEIELSRQLEMIQVNVTALVHLTHLFLPQMNARGTGGVMNVASTAAFQPGPRMAIYYATKAFVLSFSEAISEELRQTGVRVSALCPGPTHSEFRARAKMEESGVFKTSYIPVMTSEAVARIGYRGFMRGKRVIVTGLANKLGVLAGRIVPRKAITKLAASINKNK